MKLLASLLLILMVSSRQQVEFAGTYTIDACRGSCTLLHYELRQGGLLVIDSVAWGPDAATPANACFVQSAWPPMGFGMLERVGQTDSVIMTVLDRGEDRVQFRGRIDTFRDRFVGFSGRLYTGSASGRPDSLQWILRRYGPPAREQHCERRR